MNGSQVTPAATQQALLRSVLVTTLRRWTGEIELDLASVFDRSGCGLRCFTRTRFNPDLCPTTIDCMGLFKIQKGFDGFVTGPAVDCSKMYPLCRIWSRDDAQQAIRGSPSSGNG
ncbi:hypothetical protein ACFLSJ_03540 [Verrucomicrobiota bacterium]